MTEETFDREKVEELVADATAEQLLPVIEEAGPEKLAALKDAEEAGKARKGVLSAIEDRGLELEEQSVEADEDVSAGTESFEAAPVDELLPVIQTGFWVRLGADRALPKDSVGRDAVVVFAPVKESQGQDTMSPGPYQYQDGTEVFTVRLRDTSELFQVTRAAFAKVATEQAALLAA